MSVKWEFIREAVVPIGYWYRGIPQPIWLGTGFIVGNSSILTCAHVVSDVTQIPNTPFKHRNIPSSPDGTPMELCCWIFKYKSPDLVLIRLPVTNIGIPSNMDNRPKDYFGEIPDVALLAVDTANYHKKFPDNPLPKLTVSSDKTVKIGTDMVLIGYPATSQLMTVRQVKMNCREALSQYCRVSGILPHSQASKPHFYAFDTAFAKGSSGSPILELDNGRVIAMAAQLLPFSMPIASQEGVMGQQAFVPAAIGFGIPSYLFHRMCDGPSAVQIVPLG